MNRRNLSFIALAASILYGAGFAIFNPVPSGYVVGGAAVIAIAWISVGVFGKDVPEQPSTATTTSDQPYGTPPQDQP